MEMLNMVDEPLSTLPQAKTIPAKAALDEVIEELR
jgi:hypothetical protein